LYTTQQHIRLDRYIQLSIAAAVVTIAFKLVAYQITQSIGLLSDALESFVNLFVSIMALYILRRALQPPDAEHQYGHTKIEYFSSGMEGMLIVVVAISIAITSVSRLTNPRPLLNLEIGAVFSMIASLINFSVAQTLIRTGKAYRSIALEADGRHLMTDVWTSIGVIVSIILIRLTRLEWLDPLIGLAVMGNILWVGLRLLRASALGLIDTALPLEKQDAVKTILEGYKDQGIQWHALRTRQSGVWGFVSFHILVPGQWTVQTGHDLLEKIEREIREAIPNITVFTHLEPLDDEKSWQDTQLRRTS
jgi:cation diffusion facilitator family transporter